MSKILIVAAWFIAVLIGANLGKFIIQSLSPPTKTPDLKGYVVDKSNFTTNCIETAVATSTPEVSNVYCSCVYDTGMAEYGGITYTAMLVELEKTATLTPELNIIVNKCVADL